jgi:UDP-2-acetamido-2,6-beta-L-arabino-hexul-4-ose reductase
LHPGSDEGEGLGVKVLVTGAEGFMGRNLRVRLERIEDCEILAYDLSCDPASLPSLLDAADVVVHLAGVNRPQDPSEFISGNLGLTSDIAEYLERTRQAKVLIFSSSIQAELDNDYGKSKLAAEERLKSYAEKTGARVRVFRFANVFGKWCRPNYNSAVATFCYNIAHELPITIRDPQAPLRLVYIDDVVEAIASEVESANGSKSFDFAEAGPVHETTVGGAAYMIKQIHDSRYSGLLPDFSDSLVRKLNSTYLSYLEAGELPVAAAMKRDERGWLFELVKSSQGGQIFVSATKPGKKRGNHFHDTKVEKFCVVKGKARISLRRIDSDVRLDFDVDGEEVRIVDIPPGYTHSIVNTGTEDCVTIFWANEIFNPAQPDTYFQEV